MFQWRYLRVWVFITHGYGSENVKCIHTCVNNATAIVWHQTSNKERFCFGSVTVSGLRCLQLSYCFVLHFEKSNLHIYFCTVLKMR